MTLRWRERANFNNTKRPCIYVFWHNRQLGLACMLCSNWFRAFGLNLSVLISGHSDGRSIAAVMQRFGYGTVTGSSTRGGRAASLAMLRHLKHGVSLAVTPDGPRGPIYKVKEGLIRLAQLSGASIYPLAFGAQHYFEFGSWDRMRLPRPFSKAVTILGEEFYVPAQLDEGGVGLYVRELEARLETLSNELDNYDYA